MICTTLLPVPVSSNTYHVVINILFNTTFTYGPRNAEKSCRSTDRARNDVAGREEQMTPTSEFYSRRAQLFMHRIFATCETQHSACGLRMRAAHAVFPEQHGWRALLGGRDWQKVCKI